LDIRHLLLILTKVFLSTRDLMFKGKLRALVNAAGAAVTPDAAAADLIVVELEAKHWEDRIRDGVARQVPVIAFGSQVDVERLRAARALGAEAVANSQIEARLGAQLQRTS
jgi:ribosomal protein L12E/L44/L45/RPP1/RPP2